MAKIIKFPNSVEINNVEFLKQVGVAFRERATPPVGTRWTEIELLVSLLESLKRELGITDEDTDHYNRGISELIIYSFTETKAENKDRK